MANRSVTPDLAALDVPIDVWSQPFWDAAAEHRLVLPQCGACGHFRWPPGPFCPVCHSQALDWQPASRARVFSFSIVPDGSGGVYVPALIEFEGTGGVRILSAIVDTPTEDIAIGMAVEVCWSAAANTTIPHFTAAR